MKRFVLVIILLVNVSILSAKLPIGTFIVNSMSFILAGETLNGGIPTKTAIKIDEQYLYVGSDGLPYSMFVLLMGTQKEWFDNENTAIAGCV